MNVVWSVNDGKLRLEWRERGGPPVKSPLKRGFGTTLIEQTAKSEGGSSHVFVEAEGLRWEITLPLNTEKSIGTAERGGPTPSGIQGPRTIRPAAPLEPLKGKRFLIVEDEPLIALDIVAGLEGVGVNVEGPIGSVRDALRAIEEGSFDGVLLDANLRGEPVDEVAAALVRHNIPFAFVTGYGRQALPESFARATVLTKPFTQEQLLRTVSQLVGSDRTGLHLLHDRDWHG